MVIKDLNDVCILGTFDRLAQLVVIDQDQFVLRVDQITKLHHNLVVL